METAQGLQITFNIRTDSEGLKTIDHTATEPKKVQKAQKVAKNPDEEVGDGYDLELINKDRLTDEEKIDLGQRISLFVRDLLNKKKLGVLRDFMDKTKHHMGNVIMDLAKDEIEEYKKNGSR